MFCFPEPLLAPFDISVFHVRLILSGADPATLYALPWDRPRGRLLTSQQNYPWHSAVELSCSAFREGSAGVVDAVLGEGDGVDGLVLGAGADHSAYLEVQFLLVAVVEEAS